MKLVIFEKNSQIKAINKTTKFSKVGEFYEGNFMGEDYRFVPLAGHVLESVPPEELNSELSWDSLAGLENLPEKIPMRVTKDKARYVASVKKALNGVSGVVCGADPDREGVGLVFELLDYLNVKLPVQGLWLNQGLEAQGVKTAFKNLKDENFFIPRYCAQQARSWSDYYWMYLVRVYTYLGRNGALSEQLGSGGSRSSVVSVGRVQSTLVALIALRDYLVKTYKPIGFFNFVIKNEGVEFDYNHNVKLEELSEELKGYVEDREKVYFTDQMLAAEFRKQLMAKGVMHVGKVDKSAFTENAPDAFSTKSLWAQCSKKLKFTAKKTQSIAEALYRDAFLTYPRTDGSHIPRENYNIEFIKYRLDSSPEFNIDLYNDVIAATKLEGYTPNVFRTVKKAHEGIIPTGQPISKLNMASDVFKELKKKTGASEADVLAVFHIVYERFAIACLERATGFKCKVSAYVDVKSLKHEARSSFSTNSKFYQTLGYLSWFDPNKKMGNEDELFIPEEGAVIEFDAVSIKKGRTARYEHFVNETLIDAMTKISKNIDDKLLAKVLEKSKGIGTEATLVDIIETVQVREYVELINGRFKVTEKGRQLIDVIEKDLCSPHLSAAWELRISEIEDETNIVKAREMRDLFLAKQRVFIQSKIKAIIEKFEPKVGTFKVVRFSGDGKPSKKQVALARKLSKDKGILLSPKVLTSVIETSKFIDKALNKDKGDPAK